jgi:hypothetical protein
VAFRKGCLHRRISIIELDSKEALLTKPGVYTQNPRPEVNA